jgi:cytochrome c biogenesis protein CcdA
MELLPAIVGLAVVDSINPSALLATIALLLRGRPARPLVAVYVVAVLVTYFAIGLALTLGLGLTPRALLESDAAYLAQGVLGAAMLAYAVLAPGRRRERGPAEPRRLPAAGRPAAVFALGVAVTVLELPTALPYLGAVGAITRADLAVGDWLPLLVTYNLIFVLPPLALLAGHMALGDRAGVLLERLRDRLGGAAREGMLWLLGLVGFFLLADALGHFGVISRSGP